MQKAKFKIFEVNLSFNAHAHSHLAAAHTGRTN